VAEQNSLRSPGLDKRQCSCLRPSKL